MVMSTIEVQPHELLRLLRQRAGLTQWRAAGLLKMSQTTLCEMERGHRKPTAVLLDLARKVYGLTNSEQHLRRGEVKEDDES